MQMLVYERGDTTRHSLDWDPHQSRVPALLLNLDSDQEIATQAGALFSSDA